ncbi:MAG: cytochrome c oxidase assembly protein [Betaproteobacteria bacterium]|nr:cytochrome c oxidase assembly protein [Betaproteobacteria bacterium]
MASILEFLLPWDFSPAAFLAWSLSVLLYARGLRRMPAGARPGTARSIAYFSGGALTYFVLQTKYEYLSTHMFFLHALQQLAVHHVGPFLVALSWPQAVLGHALPLRGARAVLDAIERNAFARGAYALLQNGFVAPALFVGLIVLWLLPGVHFDAMLSARVYWWMNWSMLLDGLLFWILALDPRSRRAGALLGYGARMAMLLLMMLPEMLIGAYIALSGRDLYQVYDVCGRAWAMPARADQALGGLILWVPVAMVDLAGFLVLVRWTLRADQGLHVAPASRAGGPPPSTPAHSAP